MALSSANDGLKFRNRWFKSPHKWLILSAILIFQLIHQLYEQSSLILTSNRSPEEWTEIVGNQGMMTAILDRLLHQVEVIHLNNESHRLKHQQKIFKD
ncbi:ATP-binding protein [Aureibacillus halotolerans]|uniref:ATP-binding protein n=1 Tax=Aureibacillus halotolerans TaxID=1508390 RepID=UPI002444EAC9|nr:ATP-binding protein [Aureibacillus halotolerans]